MTRIETEGISSAAQTALALATVRATHPLTLSIGRTPF